MSLSHLNDLSSAWSRPSERGAGTPRPPRGLWALLSGMLMAAVAGGLYLVSRPGDPDPGPALEHIHGVGVDAADGAIYAGTHVGPFRIDAEGVGTRVAGRIQDFMGFTVLGADRFLASGHPGEGESGPDPVGLLESTDRGQSWEAVSLAGRADFHALESADGRLYGLDSRSGSLMSSPDGRKWRTVSTLPMADIAVSPDDADVLLATTSQGMVRSKDGGRTFDDLKRAPLLLLVDWADDGTLVGVTPEGDVVASGDGGDTWKARGSLGGEPEALEAVSGEHVVAASGGAVLESVDGGASFTVRYGG